MGELDQALAIAGVVALNGAGCEIGDAPGTALPGRGGQLGHLLEARAPRRHGTVRLVDVRGGLRGREAGRARPHRLAHVVGHPGALLGSRVALRGGVPHDVAAERRVPDVDRRVDTETAVEDLEEGREGLPVPGEPAPEHTRRHALDLGEELGQPGAIGRPARGDRVAAVARHHRRDAVVAGGGPERLEGELRVVVRVHVDDAGHHDEPVGGDRPPRARQAPDVGDHARLDADVGDPHRQARSVDHPATFDDRIEGHSPVSRHPSDSVFGSPNYYSELRVVNPMAGW